AHRGQHRGDAGHVGAVVVERDHLGTAPEELERVPAATAAQVEHAVAGAKAQLVHVHGQHRWESIAVRYTSTVRAAAARHVNRATPRARPAAPRRARRSASARAVWIAAASAWASPGATSRAVSPSDPATSGSAPPVVATTGVAHAIASTSGSEKPSNS